MRKAMTEQGLAQPVLHRDQINAAIDALLSTVRDRNLGQDIGLYEETAAYLTAFYTRRWGLPPAVTARAAGIRV